MSLQVQESTLKSFFDRTGSLARGTGFLARFLFAMPDSNQGNRFFEEAPSNWPALDAFNSRISALLDTPYPIDDNGILTPNLMTLSPETKTAWVKFYNEVEAQLGEGGQLRDVRDVSSKAADNAVRLAALFQVFERGFGGTIDLESFESASRIVAWHLTESRRFYGDAALPSDLKNAAKLDHWLLSVCSREKILSVPTRRVLQSGPAGLRNKAILEMALAELQELGRLRVTVDGKHRNIEVNPKLLDNDQGS
jgi:putative DNA primase/helicase